MFEYCSSHHVDPSYHYVGSVDCAILDVDSRILLMYSMVNMGGQWTQLQVVSPIHFEDFIDMNKIKGKDLKSVFQAAGKVENARKVKTKCIRTEKENLMPIVMEDAASLTPEDQASLQTIIAEVF